MPPALTAAALSLACVACAAPPHNVTPPEGLVPDAATAIRIAVAVWEPIYGHEAIAREAPYAAALKDGVWHVEGQLPEGWIGGVALADIARTDGRVLRVSHGR